MMSCPLGIMCFFVFSQVYETTNRYIRDLKDAPTVTIDHDIKTCIKNSPSSLVRRYINYLCLINYNMEARHFQKKFRENESAILGLWFCDFYVYFKAKVEKIDLIAGQDDHINNLLPGQKTNI